MISKVKFLCYVVIVSFINQKILASDDSQRPKFDENEFVPLNYGQLWGMTQVKGKSQLSLNGKKFYSFQGIPYAEPPVDELRLKVRILPKIELCLAL